MTLANLLIGFFSPMVFSYIFLLKDEENQMPNEPTYIQHNVLFLRFEWVSKYKFSP